MPTNLIWEVFFWLMGKCTFTLMWNEKKEVLTFSKAYVISFLAM